MKLKIVVDGINQQSINPIYGDVLQVIERLHEAVAVILAYLKLIHVRKRSVKDAVGVLNHLDVFDVYNEAFVNLHERGRIVQDDVGSGTPSQYLSLSVIAYRFPKFTVLVIAEITDVFE